MKTVNYDRKVKLKTILRGVTTISRLLVLCYVSPNGTPYRTPL